MRRLFIRKATLVAIIGCGWNSTGLLSEIFPSHCLYLQDGQTESPLLSLFSCARRIPATAQGGHNEYRLSPQTEPVVLWIQSCTFLRYCVVCLVISPETKTQVVLVRTSSGQTLPTRHTGSPESTTGCHEKATRQKRQPWPREIKSNPTAFPGPDRLLFSARTNSLVSRSHSSAIPRWLGVPVTKPRQSNPS